MTFDQLKDLPSRVKKVEPINEYSPMLKQLDGEGQSTDPPFREEGSPNKLGDSNSKPRPMVSVDTYN